MRTSSGNSWGNSSRLLRNDFVRCEDTAQVVINRHVWGGYEAPCLRLCSLQKNLVPYRSKKIARRTAPPQANSQRFRCDAQVTILSLLRCGIARLTMNSKSPRCVSHPLQPKVCEPASLVAPLQIRPRIGDALRRQELDAIPSTDKAAESWAAFCCCVFLLYRSNPQGLQAVGLAGRAIEQA